MKIRSIIALCAAMLLPLFTFAADLVAKFSSLESGATSGAFTIGENGRTITSDSSWLVSGGTTVVVDYSGLSSSGTQAIVTLAQSNDSSNLSKVGICSENGILKGIWQGSAWTGGENTGHKLSESGCLVFVYYPDQNTRGVFVYDGEGTEIFRAKGLKSTGTTVTTGGRFDIGATAAGGLSQSGFTVNSVGIYKGEVAAEDIAALVEEFTAKPVIPQTGALPETTAFSWTPGAAPTGWFTSWGGEAAGNPVIKMIGPSGAISEVYRVYNDGGDDKWHPWNGMSAKSAYTLSLYGCVDMIETPVEGKYAVLWAMGGSPRTVLAMDSSRKIVLVKAEGGSDRSDATILQSIVADAIKGYHLITVTFDSSKGASLTIDAEDPKESSEFKSVSGDGFQFGSVYGGCPTNFTIAKGLVILGVCGYDAPVSKEAITTLATRYPVAETINKTLSIDQYGESIYLPSITIPDGKALRVQKGTLVVPAGVEATLGALEFGDINSGNLGFGMELDGAINIVNTKTFTDNSNSTAYNACNDGRGVNFGEWAGEGVFNIRGTFNASKTVVVLVHDASKVTINVDGGTVNVKGITANNPSRATVKLANEATFTYSEKVSEGNPKTLSEDGTYTITADNGAYKLVRVADENYVFTDTQTVDSVLNGSVSVIVNPGEGGVVTFTKANTFTGGLVVESGTAKTTNANGFGPNNYNSWANPDALGQIEVKEGATLDLANTKDTCYAITTAGTITNSGDDIGTSNRQTVKIALSGDATVSGNTFGLLAPNHNATTLDLGEHTLTVAMNEGKQFLLSNTTVSNLGTIKLKSGSLWINPNKSLNGEIKLDLSEFPKVGGTVATGTAAQLSQISLVEGQTGWSLVADGTTLNAVYFNPIVKIGGKSYDTLENALAHLTDDAVVTILKPEEVSVQDFTDRAVTLTENEDGSYTVTLDKTDEIALRFSEIMPKPSDKPYSITTQAGYDKNGLESGWVELENTSDKWVDLKDYKFCRANRGKVYTHADYGNFPSVMIPPHGRFTFYTSERYSNSASKADSAFEHGTFDGKPVYYPKYDMLIWGDKVNPKKFPYVTLVYRPETSAADQILETVIIPSDTPEGYSIIVGEKDETSHTKRWLCPTPTFNKTNSDTEKLTPIGPNVGPQYGVKHSVSEFVATAPAKNGEDYPVSMNVNPVYGGTAQDTIAKVVLVYRTKLGKGVEDSVEMTKTGTDAGGDVWTAAIPSSAIPSEPGQLIQWKTKITDAAGNEWTSPSFMNKDDGYEWFGTITDPGELNSANLPTWHMFVDAASKAQMDIDTDKQDLSVVPHNARVAIYDASTSIYHDYVRIDLRGNTSSHFNKKSHGLRFSKVNPLTMKDAVQGGEVKEIRKSSLIGEPADPSFMRQMIGFWLWNKMGNKVPFDFPVRCNLNGAFYQLGFHSERFTDELIEDVYGLDKYGYGYKNVGTLISTSAGGEEKKTPDDGNESDLSMLKTNLVAYLDAAKSVNNDNAELTKTVVERFDLPAWLNYLASARITHEMDDVWANISIYRDFAEMKEGSRGTGVWMPLGYDFNVSFGQYYHDGVVDLRTKDGYELMADQDWFKSHPFYGGMKVRCHGGSFTAGTVNTGNLAMESVLQSSKFRRLYLRRLRTLMDQELKEPGTPEEEVPFMVKMRELAELMYADSELDHQKNARGVNGWDSSFSAIDSWGQANWPADIRAGVDDIWNNYVVPRRKHLYVTHAAEGHSAEEIGYDAQKCAGIPAAQSPIGELKDKITIANMTELSAEDAESMQVDKQFKNTEVLVICNENNEAVDMSGWKLEFSVDFTLPAGTVVDANDYLYVVADRRAYITAHESGLTDQIIIGNAPMTGAGPIRFTAADGTVIVEKIPRTDERDYLRLDSFCGNTSDPTGDVGEWFTLKNISDSVTLNFKANPVTVCFLKDDNASTENDDHCHITISKGSIAPGGTLTFKQADYVGKGWVKIQNNKQVITISDKYGTTCQQLKVTQKNYDLAYGHGAYLKHDDTGWSQVYDLAIGTTVYTRDQLEEVAAQFADGLVIRLGVNAVIDEETGMIDFGNEKLLTIPTDSFTIEVADAAKGMGTKQITLTAVVAPDAGEIPDGATVFKGEVGDTTLEAGTYYLNGANFTGVITCNGAVTFHLVSGTENTAKSITAAKSLTIKGTGLLALEGELALTTDTLMTVGGDLIVESGTLNIIATGPDEIDENDKFAAVLVKGNFIEKGGVINTTLAGTKVYGISLDTKNTTATIEGGEFNATLNGVSCSALKLKGSCTGNFKGGTVSGSLAASNTKIINGGSLNFTGGNYVATMPEDITGIVDVSPYAAERTISVSGGNFNIKIPAEGSEGLSTGGDTKSAQIDISGGVIMIESGDDAINAATDINITGGFVHAVSTYSDALDANGSMSITGGYVFAFTKSTEHEALDVVPEPDNGLTHTLTIGKGAVVLAVGGKQVGEIAGDAVILKVDEETEAKSQKYVIFKTATTDLEAMTKTTKSYAVNWTGKHIGEIGDGSKFAVMIAAEEVVGEYSKGKNPSDTDTEYQPLESSYDKILVKTVSVEDITPPASIEITEKEVTPTSEDIQVAVPDGADTVEITSETVEMDEGATSIPFTTGLYTITAKNGDKVVATETLGVIAAKDAETIPDGATSAKPVTTAVAVPFENTTVATLLNTSLLSDEDTLMAYITVDGMSGYAMWTLTEGTWVGKDVNGGIAAQDNTTSLQRGTGVWVTTAGKIVTFGKYTESAPEVELEPGHNLLANVKTVEAEPINVQTGHQVQLIGDTTKTRYNKTASGWSSIKQVTTTVGGETVITNERGTLAPKVPAGRGYWLVKPVSK